MLQNVSLVFLLCVLQFQCFHSKYVLIDVHGEGSGLKAPGCGDWCWAYPPPFGNCITDPFDCPICLGLIGGICVKPNSPRINSTTHN